MTTYQGVLAALGDESRLRLVEHLSRAPASVGELARQVPISRPAVSQHLRVLERHGLVAHTAQGTRHVYRLERSGFDELRGWVDQLWSTAFDEFVAYATEHPEESS